MPVTRLKEFLDRENVKYVTIGHSPAFTAQEIAERAHIPGKELAKTVMVKIDGELAMIVVPASDQVRLAHLKEALGADEVELAGEYEFKERFPDCETAFNAGSHSELIRMAYADFERLVDPTPLVA